MDKSYKRKNFNNRPNHGRGGYNNWNNKKFKNYLQPGMKGFLCTCNTREKDCIRESQNILDEYADRVLQSIEPSKESTSVAENVEAATEVEASGDIEDELKKEVDSLKNNWRSPPRFSVVDTGVKNNLFIKTTLEDPVSLAYTILNDVAETKKQKCRFLQRIVPVEVTCRANLEDMKSAADSLFDKHFRCDPTTFAVVINKRYNDSIVRDEVIHAIALLVTDKNNEHKADLKTPKLTVLMEIMKGLCCMSVLQDYQRLRHYNLAQLAKPEEDPNTVQVKDSETHDVEGNAGSEAEEMEGADDAEVKAKGEETENGEDQANPESKTDVAGNDQVEMAQD